MKNLHNLNELHLHFIGIGGISMSGLAKLMLSKGAIISGSDTGISKEIDTLKSLGIIIYPNHNRKNINKKINLIIYSGAIKGDNPEILRAKELGIPIIERSEFLGFVSKQYDKVIAVAGTHGKTTTTAMLGLIMQYAGLNPTIHLGGESINLKGNTIIGDNKFFLVEACEYRESFRYLEPFISVITNIELDHLDYYPDFNSIHKAFSNFARRGRTLIALDGLNITHDDTILIDKDWKVKNIEYLGEGYNFNVFYLDKYFETFRINVIGLHNITNALFAIATAHKLGISRGTMVDALADYMGVERRYEKIATIHKCNIIIDYAHHPTELTASIEGIKGVYRRVLYIFQPHTYSRTLKLFDDFIEVLSGLENIILYKTYPAREKLIIGGTAEDLYNSLKVKNKEYFDDLENLINYINNNAKNYDCVLVLGAGDLADRLKGAFQQNL
ncbi:MAG: UDP-N-acetylmuramate--L-alanine ligase [Christensenellales bacterium]